MIVTVLQGRHVAVANEESVEYAVDDDVECEVGGEGEGEHGQGDAKDGDEAGDAVGEGDLREVAAEHAEVGEDDSQSEDDGQIADGEGSIACVRRVVPL